jgi:hypothetical protein
MNNKTIKRKLDPKNKTKQNKTKTKGFRITKRTLKEKQR